MLDLTFRGSVKLYDLRFLRALYFAVKFVESLLVKFVCCQSFSCLPRPLSSLKYHWRSATKVSLTNVTSTTQLWQVQDSDGKVLHEQYTFSCVRFSAVLLFSPVVKIAIILKLWSFASITSLYCRLELLSRKAWYSMVTVDGHTTYYCCREATLDAVWGLSPTLQAAKSHSQQSPDRLGRLPTERADNSQNMFHVFGSWAGKNILVPPCAFFSRRICPLHGLYSCMT